MFSSSKTTSPTTAFAKAIFPSSRVGLWYDTALGAALAARLLQKEQAKLRYAVLSQTAFLKWYAKIAP
jgi:hypothetical protein